MTSFLTALLKFIVENEFGQERRPMTSFLTSKGPMKQHYFLILVAAACAAAGCGPEAEARQHERQKIALCEKELNDPLTPVSAKITIIKPVCERFKAEFRAKYNAEP